MSKYGMFIALSCALHLIFLYSVSTPKITINERSDTIDNVDVLMGANKQSSSHSQKTSQAENTPSTKNIQTEGTGNHPIGQGSSHNANELSGHIKKYLTYPAMAKRMGWEGEAQALMELSPDGHFKFVRWTRSFQNKELTNLVEQSFQTIPPYKGSLTLTNKELIEVPIVFRLK